MDRTIPIQHRMHAERVVSPPPVAMVSSILGNLVMTAIRPAEMDVKRTAFFPAKERKAGIAAVPWVAKAILLGATFHSSLSALWVFSGFGADENRPSTEDSNRPSVPPAGHGIM